MATYLEKYPTKKSAYQDLLSQGQSLSSKELCFCMEAIYRAQVLETLSLLERTCPTVQDLSAFELHARLVSGILAGLLEERRFQIYKDKKIANEQAAAYQSCFSCFNEFAKLCSPCNAAEYPQKLHQMLYTFCCAWLQYRNTIIDLDHQYFKSKKEALTP